MFIKGLNEECGVFGVFNVKEASKVTFYGLHSLQHRGQEGCGIVSNNGINLKIIKGEGLLTENFNDDKFKKLDGYASIGHVRYSTTGGGGIENVQPFLFKHYTGAFSLAHNGSIVNYNQIRKVLENKGSIFQSTSDSEILAHLMKKDERTPRLNAIIEALRMLEGSFAILLMTIDKLYVIRDKHGLRPLSLGKLGEGYVVASETCALDTVGATFIRDIEPGEVLTISNNGLESTNYSLYKHNYMCAMEYIYFARPDSIIEGLSVHNFRVDSGKVLAKKNPIKADLVCGVPDSSISAAIGYSIESGIPYEPVLLKNKYIGRTFIEPTQELREKTVRMKLSVIKPVVEGKTIILVDDSIVRATTSKRIVALLKECGVKEVHVRIAAPEITHPCFYGVDFSTFDELISAKLDKEEVRKYIKADSLEFLSVDDLLSISKRNELCCACFNGDYPTNIYESLKDVNKDK